LILEEAGKVQKSVKMDGGVLRRGAETPQVAVKRREKRGSYGMSRKRIRVQTWLATALTLMYLTLAVSVFMV